jgi:hypothetical protein
MKNGVRIEGVYIFASFELQIHQILYMQCISPALLHIVNTHIFLSEVPNTSPLRNAVAIPKILDSMDACGGFK